QYLHRALGSSEETLLHLKMLYETKSLQDEGIFKELSEKYERLGKMLFRFIEAVLHDHGTPTYIKEENANCEA
ncbi:MAG: four helix bundle protein, partial [Ignavibacteriales bacterium]|nr:four helix bundle protein [Ignavibacteriales bacterium]